MSHAATNWAIKQRGLKPAAKLVLWHLCDRFHPDHGCFPSQEMLADDVEMSRSALNEHLAVLEGAQLIRREVRRNASSKRQESTRYRFAFEPDFEAALCPESGHGAVSGNEPEPCPENDESRVRNPDTNLVSEPVREPEREARAREPGKSEARDTELLAGLKRQHPGSAHEDPEVVALLWSGLGRAERQAAHDRHGDWLEEGRKARRTVVPKLAFYLGKKLWNELPKTVAKAASEAEPPARIGAFDRPWWALWIAWVSAHPDAGDQRSHAGQFLAQRVSAAFARIGWAVVRALLAETEARGMALVQVPVDGTGFAAWRSWYRDRHGVALPLPDAARYVWLPAQAPPDDEGVAAAMPEPVGEAAE